METPAGIVADVRRPAEEAHALPTAKSCTEIMSGVKSLCGLCWSLHDALTFCLNLLLQTKKASGTLMGTRKALFFVLDFPGPFFESTF